MPRNCAFLTLENREGFCIYDHLLVEPLAAYGWAVEEIPWTRPGVAWSDFEAVVIRSTWDYQRAPEAFLATLESIAEVTPLFNPVEICRWNLNKRYLRDLQQKGIGIVPTTWLPGLSLSTIKAEFETFDTDRLVAKPLVGANADDTFVLQRGDPETWQAALEVFARDDVMLQPFLRAIPIEGEYSLFYFGGQSSHAILKRPAIGDFRVQEEHGGIIQAVEPADDLAFAGEAVIRAIGEPLLYARVDFVRLDSGAPALIELELIEPSLYFEQCADAAQRFADQFQRLTA